MNAVHKNEPGSNGPRGNTDDVDEGSVSPDVEPLPLSQVFDILSNARRRHVLRILRDNGGSSTLSDVAETVAAWENDKEVSEITSSERKRTYVGLYQCHLPKMDDHGVIEFDKHRGDIRLGPRAPRLFEYMDNEPTRTQAWAKYYLALAGAWGGTLLAGQVAGIGFLTSPAVVGFLLLTFIICGLFHYRATTDTDPPKRSLSTLVEAGPEET